MKRLTIICALALIAIAPLLSADHPQQPRAYVVTLDPGRAGDAAQTVEQMAASFGATVESGSVARADKYVLRLSPSRARALAADPRVQSVVPLEPVADAAQSEVVAWTGGVSIAYDGAGNVRQIGKDTFVYDHVSRLVQANVNGTRRNYEYDAYGNRKKCLQNSGTAAAGDCQGYTVDSDSNRIVEAVYDPSGTGAVATLGIHNYSYDEFLMMKRDQSATVREFVYTASDERVAVYDATSRSWRWTVRDPSNKVLREFASSGGALGTDSFSWKKDFVWRDSVLLASRQPEGSAVTTYHYHVDHQGTPRRITDNHDNLLGFHDYFAFGPEVPGGKDETSPTQLKVTGHERDEAGDALGTLDYMHARFYNPVLGRFLTLDPVQGDPFRPQTWNRYAYALNNPFTNSDPDGRCTVDGEEHGWFWCFLHALDLVHTQKERAQILRTIMANDRRFILYMDGKPVDPMKLDDQMTFAAWDAYTYAHRNPQKQEQTKTIQEANVPFMTQWGWNNSSSYRTARAQLDQPGTHETVNGRIPTRAEAERMITENGGKIVRVEGPHGANSVSHHRYPHINYETSSGLKATVRIQSVN